MESEEKARKKEPQQKERLQATQLVRTIKNLTEVRAEDLKVYKRIKKTEKIDLFFLLFLPTPLWPIYFIYSSKIKVFFKDKMVFTASKNKACDVRKQILSDYGWIKKVIRSSESRDHIESCKKLVENWSGVTSNKIRDYKCSFYKTSEITKTIETYIRAKKEINILLAEKSAQLRGVLINF